jgi:hypothetical protein
MHNKAPKCGLFWQHLAAAWQQNAAGLRPLRPRFPRSATETLPEIRLPVVGQNQPTRRNEPQTPPLGDAGATVKITLCLIRGELAELDRSRVIQRALKEDLAPRVIGREE